MKHKEHQVPKDVYNEISNICEHFGRRDLEDDLIKLMNEIYEKDLYNGRTKKSMVGGVFYTVVKQEDVAISAKKISDFLDIEKRSLILTNKYISNNLSKFNHLPTDWKSYIEMIDEKNNIDDKIIEMSLDIGDMGTEESYLSGKKPQSYAASCIYAASKIYDDRTHVTQEKLCSELDISCSTIRASYNNLVELYNSNDKKK